MPLCEAETRRHTSCKRRVRQPGLRCVTHQGQELFREPQFGGVSVGRQLIIPSERELIVDRIFNDAENTPVTIMNDPNQVIPGYRHIRVSVDIGAPLPTEFWPMDNVVGRGGNGMVINMAPRQGNGAKFALKIDLQNQEQDIARQLDAGNNVCKQLRVRYIGEVRIRYDNRVRRCFISVMESMDGDITRMFREIARGKDAHGRIPRIPPHGDGSKTLVAFRCAELIRLQLLCLYERDLFYTDFKLQNVMYKVLDYAAHRKKSFIVMLGDIGAMGINDDGDMASTYPSPETRRIHNKGYGMIPRALLEARNNLGIRHLLAWNIGAFFAQVVNIYSAPPIPFHFRVPTREFEDNRRRLQLRVRRMFGDVAASYLERRGEDRPDVFDMISVIYA